MSEHWGRNKEACTQMLEVQNWDLPFDRHVQSAVFLGTQCQSVSSEVILSYFYSISVHCCSDDADKLCLRNSIFAHTFWSEVYMICESSIGCQVDSLGYLDNLNIFHAFQHSTMHGQVMRKLNKEFSNIYHYHLSSISQMVLRRIEGRGTGSFLEGIAPIPPPTPRVSQ